MRNFALSFTIFVVIYVAIAFISNALWGSQNNDLIASNLLPGLISVVIFVVLYFSFATYFARRQR